MTTDFITRSLTAWKHLCGILSLLGFSKLAPPSPYSALPPLNSFQTLALKLFRENQLSPSSIGISPLATPHPRSLQRTWVRTSMELYLHFILDMARSHGFGSIATNFIRPVQTRFPFASTPEVLKLAANNNSPDRSTKSTTSSIDALCVLVNTRFQVLFHSPPGVLFTFPSQYYTLSVTR